MWWIIGFAVVAAIVAGIAIMGGGFALAITEHSMGSKTTGWAAILVVMAIFGGLATVAGSIAWLPILVGLVLCGGIHKGYIDGK